MRLLTRIFVPLRSIILRVGEFVSSRAGRSLLVASFATLLHGFLFIGMGDFLEPWALEVWFNVRGAEKAPEDVVLIAMDEDSYDELDLQMSEVWPRVIHAELLDRLAAAGARVVAFDVLFAGPSDDPAGDEDLAESLGGLPTVIGVQMDNPTGTEPGTSNQLIFPYEPFQKQAKLALVGLPQEEDMILRFKTSRDAITEGYQTLSEVAAGELKHGPIALIEDGLPVIIVMPSPKNAATLHSKLLSNIREIQARGAITIVIAEEGDETVRPYADHIIEIPAVSTLFQPLLSTIPLQVFAASVARARGYDVDKPRNLAKSVTVE
jgi:hypothetical protein